MAGRRSRPSSHQAADQVQMQDNNVEPLSYYMSRGTARTVKTKQSRTISASMCFWLERWYPFLVFVWFSAFSR